MNKLTSTAIVAIVAGTIGVAALTPAAFAQQGPNPGQPGNNMQMEMPNHHQFGNQQIERRFERMRNARPGVRQGSLLDLTCAPNGAERTEVGFVRLAYRLELTPEQQTLFDDLKTATLTAQTQFADQCEQPPAPGTTAEAQPPVPPNPVERLTAQIGNDSARLELMQGLLPKLEAFFNSLTDAQKATLQPQPRERNDRGFRRHGELPGQPGMPGALGEQPAAPDAPEGQPTALIMG